MLALLAGFVNSDTAELREELLKVEHERTKFQTNVKILEEDLVMLKADTVNIRNESGRLFKELKAHETAV
jgi:predicted  nucleic acid-binding Zn-ribbon protein